MALVQVSGQTHQPDLGQAKVRQLDVAHGGDEQTRKERAHFNTLHLSTQDDEQTRKESAHFNTLHLSTQDVFSIRPNISLYVVNL